MRTPEDRRRCERVGFHSQVTVDLSGGDVTLKARSANISLAGVGLICPSPLPVGQPVTLTFHLTSRAGPVRERVTGRVISLRFDDDVALIGVEFDAVLGQKATAWPGWSKGFDRETRRGDAFKAKEAGQVRFCDS